MTAEIQEATEPLKRAQHQNWRVRLAKAVFQMNRAHIMAMALEGRF
jgi:hypothetical protein